MNNWITEMSSMIFQNFPMISLWFSLSFSHFPMISPYDFSRHDTVTWTYLSGQLDTELRTRWAESSGKISPRWPNVTSIGCFLKWWYLQIIHLKKGFSNKFSPSILGYDYFRKHPYKIIYDMSLRYNIYLFCYIYYIFLDIYSIIK